MRHWSHCVMFAALVALAAGCGSPTTTGYNDVLGDRGACQLEVYASQHDQIWDARVHSGDT